MANAQDIPPLLARGGGTYSGGSGTTTVVVLPLLALRIVRVLLMARASLRAQKQKQQRD